MSLRAALGVVAREPLALLTLIFTMRLLAVYPLGSIFLAVIPLGYLTRVLRGALQDDGVPLPGASKLPGTAALGCAAWLALGIALLSGGLAAVLLALALEKAVPGAFAATIAVPLVQTMGPAEWANPINWLLWPLMLWSLSAMWVAVACEAKEGLWSRINHDANLLGSMLATWFGVVVRPPLNRDGLVLWPLLGLMLATSPWFPSTTLLKFSALGCAVPVLCGVLYAHCLGQYVRERFER